MITLRENSGETRPLSEKVQKAVFRVLLHCTPGRGDVDSPVVIPLTCTVIDKSTSTYLPTCVRASLDCVSG